MYFGQTIDPVVLEPFARRFDDIILQTFLKVLEIENISEDQKLQIQEVVVCARTTSKNYSVCMYLRLC